ncbi:MAG: branched-chain amino acid ABC transporter permease [Gemmatimonadota bacterium]
MARVLTFVHRLRLAPVWGAVAVFVSLIGMVETFAGRGIVDGVLSLADALLLFIGAAAGFQAARFDRVIGWKQRMLGAVAAGAVVGALLAALILLGHWVDLRRVFVNASPVLFNDLSFGQGVRGAYWPIVAGAAAGTAGGVGALLPPAVQGPVGRGLVVVLLLALFQDLLNPLLSVAEPLAMLRDSLYGASGLSIAGAVIALVITAAASALWMQRGRTARRWYAALPIVPRRGLAAFALLVAVALVIALPPLAGPFVSTVLVFAGLYALMGLGLNVVVGFAGLLDLGYVAFFAIGAYTTALLTSTDAHGLAHLSFWIAAPVSMAMALLAGVLLGIPVLGIRGDYLAIATLGFGEIIRLLVLSDFLRPWLGGSQGVLAVPKPRLDGIELASPGDIFYVTLVACAVLVFVAARLRDSRLGRAWMAMREDEDVAQAMGINLVATKLAAFGFGATFGGLAGAIFASFVGSVFPQSFQLIISINVLSLIIVGGMGSMPGVIVGALVLVGLPELLREFSDFRYLVYGAALVYMMRKRPEGLWPAAAVKRELHAEQA